jgi:drug/metabolite transporter (DMT)-like permease
MSITQVTRDKSRGALGLGLALFTAATFGTSGTFADSLMATGWTPGAVVTARITLAAVFLTIPAALSLRGGWGLLREAAPQLLAYGLVAVAGCQLFFFNAVEHLDVGVALLLEYSGIVLIVLWMWLRHGNRPRRLTIIGGAAALIGLVFVLNPGASSIDPIGIMWGLLAACGLAVFFVLSANADSELPPLALAWAAMVIGAVTLILLDLAHVLPFHAETADVTLLHRQLSWLVPIIGLSFVAAAVAYAAGIAAARLLGAKLASFVGLTEVLFAVLFAWAALGQAPSGVQLVGGVVVLIGIALVRTDETEPQVPAAEATPAAVSPTG